MAPKLPRGPSEAQKWVPVTWMPHTSLSTFSHVGVMIRSAHAVIDHGMVMTEDSTPEWKCRVGVYGIGGTPLAPIQSVSHSSRANQRDSSNPRRQPVANATHDCEWNWFLSLPIRWRDLPRDAYLLFELLQEGSKEVLYRTTLPLFSRYGRMHTGLRKLEFQSEQLNARRNYGLVSKSEEEEKASYMDDSDPVWKAYSITKSIERNEERVRSKPNFNDTFGEVPCIPWLDQLQKERCRQIIDDHAKEETDPLLFDSVCACLVVELPEFDIPIMYEETFYPIPPNGASGVVAPADLAAHRKRATGETSNTGDSFDPMELVTYLEYENEFDNPYEDKYRTLAHDLLRGLVDPALKPDREQRIRLGQIIDSPSHQLTREQRDLLWRFRFSLVDNRRALTKFLVAVDWTVESEVVQAVELLDQWRKRSPIEVTDALKLLGKNVAFQTGLVRDYAIETLASAPDSELRLYLLQLVQAIKYENVSAAETSSGSSEQKKKVSSLAAFLIRRAAANVQLANYLYWYLKVECADSVYGAKYQDALAQLKERLSNVSFSMSGLQEAHAPDDSVLPFKSLVESVSKLGSSLRKHADPTSEKARETKKQIKQRSMWEVLEEQDKFISGLLDVQHRCRTARGKKDAKENELKALLSKEGFNRKASRGPVPLPSTPEMFVNGVRPEKSKMFKSALYPAVLDFYVEGTLQAPTQEAVSAEDTAKIPKSRQTATEERVNAFKVIVKTGDDLRQDQLVIMMIQLMDRLLKRAALDLCLSPYSIIATSPSSGLVEFVDKSMPISEILASHNGSIMQFFQKNSPKKGAKYEVQPEVISTYVRSCAGYCVITYLLGVGDRHLDNLMLRLTGHFFHIDFGFIFGRDPKPLPPAFRLTREMVDGMGGTDSSDYRQFCSLACQAFKALRKSAGLVLNLLSLMSDANIEDLSNNPSADAEGVLGKVEERFRLDLDDEQAERFFVSLINDCQAAIAPRVMDVFHSIAVARR